MYCCGQCKLVTRLKMSKRKPLTNDLLGINLHAESSKKKPTVIMTAEFSFQTLWSLFSTQQKLWNLNYAD